MTAMPLPEKTPWTTRLLRILVRLAIILAIGFSIGWTLNRVHAACERRAEPAGFRRGVLQGALMPMTMPNLIFGRDVAIYAANNTGRTYKLGYTMGVNASGLIFFGVFFWRLRRLRKEL
jgi:hypothetical protein